MVECPRCRRNLKNARGLKIHQRWGVRCYPLVEEIIVASRQGTPTPGPINRRDLPRFMQRFTPELEGLRNNLLYFTAIEDDMASQPGDNFSIISDHVVNRYQVPDEVLAVDENERPRDDGRHQRVIDYVEGVIEANRPPVVPEPWFFEKLFYRQPFILFRVFSHGIRLFCILFFLLAILYCHNGICTASVNHYYFDIDRFRRLIFNQK